MTTVLSVVPTLGIGGAEAIAADIAVGLGGCADLQSHLHVAAEIRGERGLAIRFKLERAGVSVTVGGAGTPKSWRAVGKLWQAVHAIRPRVVLVHLSSSEVLASTLRFSPQVRNLALARILHTPGLGIEQRLASGIYERTVACSDEVAQHALKAGAHRVSTILNGIDLTDFPEPVDTQFGSSRPFDIAMVARGGLHGPKGADLAIEAVGRLCRTRSARLHLFGTRNEERPEILAYAKTKGAENAIAFHGIVPNLSESIAALRPAIGLMPSRHEGLSVALMEFSALGVPLLLSDIPSFKNVYREGFAWRFFKAGDADGLARMLAAPTEQPGSGYAILAREAFGNAGMVDAYADMVRSLADGRK